MSRGLGDVYKRQEQAAPITVEFPLSEVEHAHLIAELDFKGGRK